MKPVSLLELNQLITKTLEQNLEPGYWVIAEISEIRLAQKGHCYLEMVEKDGDAIKAKTRATIWSYTYRNLITWFESKTGETLKPGLKILFNAVVQYHEVFGLSLNIRDIDVNFTLGERARRKTEIIEKLKEDGVFDMNKELPLPVVPQQIAVISSPSAAGYGDFIDQISNNPYGYTINVSLFPATMQGKEAAASIIAAMHAVFQQSAQYDLLVIIRGGGASADLDCYDNYELASHVAQFPLPVITGIGHERDETIIDLVAHTKMKTPTAVAEFLISDIKTYEEEIIYNFQKILSASVKILDQQSFLLERSARKLCAIFKNICTEKEKKLDKTMHSLKHLAEHSMEKRDRKLTDLSARLRSLPSKIIYNEHIKIDAAKKFVGVLDPENVLKRGYSITRINGVGLNKYSDAIKEGDVIVTTTAKAELESNVKLVKPRK